MSESGCLLLNLFLPVIERVLNTQLSEDPDYNDFQQIRDSLYTMLADTEAKAADSDIDIRDYDEARFAVCAWIDESLLAVSDKLREFWSRNLLQRHFYDLSNAGELFFTRLAQLSPARIEVKEIYLLCIALGFAGVYGEKQNVASLQKYFELHARNCLNEYGIQHRQVDVPMVSSNSSGVGMLQYKWGKGRGSLPWNVVLYVLLLLVFYFGLLLSLNHAAEKISG